MWKVSTGSYYKKENGLKRQLASLQASFNGNIARTDLENRNILISSPLSEESMIKLRHDLKTGANQGCGCEVLEEWG